jgi:hypothetical protein
VAAAASPSVAAVDAAAAGVAAPLVVRPPVVALANELRRGLLDSGCGPGQAAGLAALLPEEAAFAFARPAVVLAVRGANRARAPAGAPAWLLFAVARMSPGARGARAPQLPAAQALAGRAQPKLLAQGDRAGPARLRTAPAWLMSPRAQHARPPVVTHAP